MKTAVLQSNFLPWRGYFDVINKADKFILYDCVQYTKNDWRNRNKILSKNGIQWLTLPVKRPSSWCKINEVTITSKDIHRAIKSIELCYKRAPYYCILEDVVVSELFNFKNLNGDIFLSEVNKRLIIAISELYGLKTEIVSMTEIQQFKIIPNEEKSSRLLRLLNILGTDIYVSGPSASDYLKRTEKKFNDLNIEIEYIEYPNYSPYEQFNSLYVAGMSIIDFIAHVGNTDSPLHS